MLKKLLAPLAALFVFAGCATVPEAAAAQSRFTISDARGVEGSVLTHKICRTGKGNATVRFVTTAQTATNPTDYTARNSTATFSGSAACKDITVTTREDTLVEGPETYLITLTPVSNAVIADAQGVGTIDDNDVVIPTPPTPQPQPLTLGVVSQTVNENHGMLYVQLTRSGDLSQPLKVSWWPAAETAIANQDYSPNSGEVTFAAGSATATANLAIIDDADYEQNERFIIHQETVVNGVKVVGEGYITILSDDLQPTQPPITVLEPAPDAEGNIASPTLQGVVGLRVPDHDYMTSLAPSWGTGAIPERNPAPLGGGGVTGDFRQICAENLIASNDHLRFFGQPGRSHPHNFNGNEDVNASSTSDTLISHGNSSCNYQGNGHAVQRSAYWKPVLTTEKTENGVKKKYGIKYDWASLYYKALPDEGPYKDGSCGFPGTPRTDGVPGYHVGICIHFPNGIRIITGNKLNPNNQFDFPPGYRLDAEASDFYCHVAADGKTGAYTTLAALKVGSPKCREMLARDNFPDCWDGKWLWRQDRTHVAFGGYGDWGYYRCSTSHPYKITGIMVSYNYRLADDEEVQNLRLVSDDINPAFPAGWSKHGDIHLVWDERVKDMQLNGCIRQRLNCSGGDLGNGWQLKGGSQPYYGWTNPNRLVPFENISTADTGTHTAH